MAKAIKIAGKFENTRVYVHRQSKKKGRRVDGRYIRVGGVFRLGTPPLKPLQFIGIHDHLCMTISCPDYVEGVLDVAADLPVYEDTAAFTWCSSVKWKVQQDDLWYFIPRTMWGFKEGEYDSIIKTVSTLSIVKGIGGGTYYLINMPLLDRRYLRSRYKKPIVHVMKKPNQKKNQDKKS